MGLYTAQWDQYKRDSVRRPRYFLLGNCPQCDLGMLQEEP